MTQKEFTLRAIIAMASNPKYVEMATRCSVTSPTLCIDCILNDASNLLDSTDAKFVYIFDDDSVNDKLDNLAKTIDGYDPHLVLDNIEDSLHDIARGIADINQSGILVDATVHDGD